MHPSTREDSTALSVRLSLDAAFGHANETRLRVCILYNNIIYIYILLLDLLVDGSFVKHAILM